MVRLGSAQSAGRGSPGPGARITVGGGGSGGGGSGTRVAKVYRQQQHLNDLVRSQSTNGVVINKAEMF